MSLFLELLIWVFDVQTPLQTPIQTPLPGTGDNSTYNIPTGANDYPSSGNDTGGNADGKGARPAPYMVNFILLDDPMIYQSIFQFTTSNCLFSFVSIVINLK